MMKQISVTFASAAVLALNAVAQPEIITQPQGDTVAAGSEVTFSVDATGSSPIVYQWYFNAVNNPINGATNDYLTLRNIQSEDVGFYRVKVTNPEGSRFSASAQLLLLLPPTISIEPTNQMTALNDSASFNVEATGDGPFSYQWKHDGTNLKAGTNRTLVLDNIQAKDGGLYSVEVTNPGGTVASQAARLSVFTLIHPPFNPGLRAIRTPNQLTLEWNGEGDLELADSPSGPWRAAGGTENSRTIFTTNHSSFYRLVNPHPRSVRVFLPSIFNHESQLPLIILLEGYKSGPEVVEGIWNLLSLVDEREFLYCFPSGISNVLGYTFWNATDACCNLYGDTVDDVAFLSSLIQEAGRTLGADPKRIYLIGWSNGGYMAYRMACERPDLIAAICSYAGVTFKNAGDCQPSEPVNILHIHGTDDALIGYEGTPSTRGVPRPGAMETIQLWANYNGCENLEIQSSLSMDLIADLPGQDTRVTRYLTELPGGAVELWTIQNGVHRPNPSAQFSPLIVDWLLSHSKQ